MKCIVLAAGYATRLYPLTENFPKPLLDVNGKSILDWLLEDVDRTIDVNEYIIVTNHRFVEKFEAWKRNCNLTRRITILDDGSTTNENRLGAVKDIAFAIEKLEIEDDLMVLAGDNLLDFSLENFAKYFGEKQHTCVMRHYEDVMEKLRRTGVATVDENGLVLEMQEKPIEPKSNWAIPPFYIYKEDDLYLIRRAILGECDTDAPGDFIAWLCKQCQVYAYEMPGKRYDVGNLESYKYVRDNYVGIIK